jgi:hypothetical protein
MYKAALLGNLASYTPTSVPVTKTHLCDNCKCTFKCLGLLPGSVFCICPESGVCGKSLIFWCSETCERICNHADWPLDTIDDSWMDDLYCLRNQYGGPTVMAPSSLPLPIGSVALTTQ